MLLNTHNFSAYFVVVIDFIVSKQGNWNTENSVFSSRSHNWQASDLDLSPMNSVPDSVNFGTVRYG